MQQNTTHTEPKIWVRWLRLLALAVVSVVGLVRVWLSFVMLSTSYIYFKDLMQEYVLIRAARANIDPYTSIRELATHFVGNMPIKILPHPTPHPPPLIVFLYPLGLMRYELAAQVWLWVEIILVLLIAILLVKWTTGKLTRYVIIVTSMGLLSWNAVASELWIGQLTILITLLLICSWLLLRQEHLVSGGLLLGVALALKLFAWPLVLFLVVKRAWKAIVASLGTFLLANLAAASMVGFDIVWNYYTSIGPSIPAYYRSFGFNFSLTTLGWRLFDGTGSPLLRAFTAPPIFKAPLLAQWISFLIPLALVGLGLILVIRYKNFDAGFGLFAMIAFLISPVVWTHYFVLTLICLAVTLRALARQGFPKRVSILFFSLVGLLWLAGESFLADIIYTFSSGNVNGEPFLPFWAGMLTYLPLLIPFALVGIMLAVTANE